MLFLSEEKMGEAWQPSKSNDNPEIWEQGTEIFIFSHF
jgi:hypothetical protein